MGTKERKVVERETLTFQLRVNGKRDRFVNSNFGLKEAVEYV